MTDQQVFKNSDQRLLEKVDQALTKRAQAGLNGLVGGLEAVVISVEPENVTAAAKELVDWTGYALQTGFADQTRTGALLKLEGSADVIIYARRSGSGANPWAGFNANPKSSALPNSRLETFVFKCPDVERYQAIQKKQGVEFLTPQPITTTRYKFIQTKPSPYTGNSVGLVQWLGAEGDWLPEEAQVFDLKLAKPADRPYLANIGNLDHSATRVRAEERDAAIIEFIGLTGYHFEFAIYVEALNSITNVARLSAEDFAMVFTSGIAPFKSLAESGPTEKFIYNYGTRVHHLAFATTDIEATFAGLKKDGLEFLVELVGSPEEGLHQTFTQASPTTLIVNEYIQRYGDFDGFFTKSNVTLLTQATDKQ